MSEERQLYKPPKQNLQQKAIERTLGDVLGQLETVGQETGQATIRRVGWAGLVSSVMMSKEEFSRAIGEELVTYYPEVQVAVETSYKGDSSDARDWPARVFTSARALQEAHLRDPQVIFSVSQGDTVNHDR